FRSSTVYRLVEVLEFAACVAQEELALDPDGEAEDVGKEQGAVECDALRILVQDQAAPRHEEVQFVHKAEAERKKDQGSDEDGVGEHRSSAPECLIFVDVAD